MVRNNEGYTLIPEMSANLEIEKKYIRRFEAPEPVREVSLIVHANFFREKLLSKLSDAIKDNLPKKFEKTRPSYRINWR
ncbi:MAG: hypothetical protein AAF990_16915 [Bacteroidota bacterium]